MKKLIPLLLLAFLLQGAASAQKLSSNQEKQVNDLFAKRKVLYFKFQVASMQEASALSKIIVIDRNQGNIMFAHADKEQFSRFIVKNFAYTVVPAPRQKVVKNAASDR